jgi:hypothetical protein
VPEAAAYIARYEEEGTARGEWTGGERVPQRKREGGAGREGGREGGREREREREREGGMEGGS